MRHNYDAFSRHYDLLMDDSKHTADFIQRQIRQHAPRARSLLELACGTGAVLVHFVGKYQLAGLDASRGMLKVARKKVLSAKLHHADMATFSLKRKFDVIYCVFDSLNHLIDFRDWKRVFALVAQHLNDGGIFLFDINTESRLRSLASRPPILKKTGRVLMELLVQQRNDATVDWKIKVFEERRNGYAKQYEENIPECSFPVAKITTALKLHFSSVKTLDKHSRRPAKATERIYFLCRK